MKGAGTGTPWETVSHVNLGPRHNQSQEPTSDARGSQAALSDDRPCKRAPQPFHHQAVCCESSHPFVRDTKPIIYSAVAE